MTRDDALALDRADPLAQARARFVLPDGVNYLDGNSLGPLPKGVAERVARTVAQEWGDGLIRSWNEAGWYDVARAHRREACAAARRRAASGDRHGHDLGQPVQAAGRRGADAAGRKTILAERGNFPSDNHIVESVARMMGLDARFVPASDIAAAIDDDTAVAELSHVNYRTAEIQDMAAVTRRRTTRAR